MRYWRTYQAVFDSPNWQTTLLFGVVCQIVPVVGPIVFLGYEFEALEEMHRTGEDTYSPFDTNRLLPYLIRGAWVFLVSLIVGLVVAVPAVLLALVLMGVAAAFPDGVVLPIVMAGFVLGMLAIQVAVALVTVPMMIRAGLSQDFGSAFSLPFLRDFVGRMWKEQLLGLLFFMATGFGVVLAGLLVCCVGVYPASVLVSLAYTHFWHQLYEEYLRRGGEPIPLKDEAGEPPMDVLPAE